MGGGGFRSSKEEWKMSKISLEAYLASNFNTLSFKDDIYFSFDYAKLYGEVFEFEYKKDGFIFKTLGVKQEILNSGFFDLQSPYGYNGIYTNTKDEDFLNEAFENLKQKALKEKIIAFFIRFHPFDEYINAYKNNLNFINKNKKIIIVPTEQDITLIRKNYNPRIKVYVKKARENLKIEFIKVDDNKDFKTLYEKTMKRNDAENFYFFDKKYFNKLYNFKEYIVLKASLNEEVLAFASFFLCKDFSYYHLSANSLKANANAALLDFFFEYANKKGSKFCILGGGVKDDDTLFNYKQKFSIVDSYFYIGGIIFNVPQYEYFCQNSKSEKFLKYRFINDSPPH